MSPEQRRWAIALAVAMYSGLAKAIVHKHLTFNPPFTEVDHFGKRSVSAEWDAGGTTKVMRHFVRLTPDQQVNALFMHLRVWQMEVGGCVAPCNFRPLFVVVEFTLLTVQPILSPCSFDGGFRWRSICLFLGCPGEAGSPSQTKCLLGVFSRLNRCPVMMRHDLPGLRFIGRVFDIHHPLLHGVERREQG